MVLIRAAIYYKGMQNLHCSFLIALVQKSRLKSSTTRLELGHSGNGGITKNWRIQLRQRGTHKRRLPHIRSVVYYAARNEACGWRCANGDLLQVLIALVKCRTAPVEFCHIKKELAVKNGHLIEAKAAANRACTSLHRNHVPLAAPAIPNLLAIDPSIKPLDMPKVSADIPNDNAQPELRPTRVEFPAGHRGRDKLAAIKDANRKKVMDAPSAGVFWNEIKKLADPKPAPVSVSADSLKDVFETRLKPAEVLPTQFDSIQHDINKILCTLLPEETEDHQQKTPWSPSMRHSVAAHQELVAPGSSGTGAP
ncbi:hypothetical protein B0H16DRAFT_1473236 [Mycena metata]|uniref:Uncharacterized protein n=1 Tax=Mycena metata TaxID=1033252 RepID=A0AAD7ML73_9AGAR|nr:hypothetical protein B0H16DRAFT_1473236 [Mycena metata]